MSETTKKVVVNRCYGGFGLSRAAVAELIGKCEHVKLMEPAKYYGGLEGWEKTFAEDQKRSGFGVHVHEGKIVLDEHREGEARSCPLLIEVVERLGEVADGDCAKLNVTEIPADVDFIIEEYDGQEWVSEAHRTW